MLMLSPSIAVAISDLFLFLPCESEDTAEAAMRPLLPPNGAGKVVSEYTDSIQFSIAMFLKSEGRATKLLSQLL